MSDSSVTVRLPSAASSAAMLASVPFLLLTLEMRHPLLIFSSLLLALTLAFITTGPTLEWTADGREPSGTLRFDGPRSVRVRARASSQFPLKNLELIINGVVIPMSATTNNAGELLLDKEVKLDRAGWLAVRCTSANTSASGGPMLGAHSNPIYIEMPSHPFDARADAEYFLAWIDRLDADLKNRDRIPVGLEHVRKQLDDARTFYRRLASAPLP